MKRKNSKSIKTIAIASGAGAAIVAVTMVVAYNSAVKKLIPTATPPYSTTVYSSASGRESDVPVQNTLGNVPKEDGLIVHGNDAAESSSASAKPKGGESEPAEEVNKPVNVEMGNTAPVEGEVSHPFSNGELVKSETLGVWKTHDGCDILCELGTDVKSMSEGIVKRTDNDPVWGICVTIEQTNGLEVTYRGLAKELNVKTGQQVKLGEIIGKTGDTNQAEILQEPHLHLEVKRGEESLDPMSVITC